MKDCCEKCKRPVFEDAHICTKIGNCPCHTSTECDMYEKYCKTHGLACPNLKMDGEGFAPTSPEKNWECGNCHEMVTETEMLFGNHGCPEPHTITKITNL